MRAEAQNKEGDYSATYNGFFSGMVNGYTVTESSDKSSATTSQSAASVASTQYGYYSGQHELDACGGNAEEDYVHSWLGDRIGVANGETTPMVVQTSHSGQRINLAQQVLRAQPA
jgi:hypothetical protein